MITQLEGHLMAINLPILILFLITLISLWLAGRVLLNLSWVLGWIRGTLGFVMLIVTAACSLLAYDLSRYHDIAGNDHFVTVSSTNEETGGWQLRVASSRGDPTDQIIDGDLWSLTARYVKFGDTSILVKPQFVRGRYYSLVEENTVVRLPKQLPQGSRLALDSWPLIISLAERIPFLEAGLINLHFTPLVENGLYGVSYKPHSLVVKPLNEPAIAFMNTSL